MISKSLKPNNGNTTKYQNMQALGIWVTKILEKQNNAWNARKELETQNINTTLIRVGYELRYLQVTQEL